jgi:hypothetical protein
MLRLPGRALVLAVVLILALGTSGITVARQRERSARAGAHLAAAEVHLAAASRAFGDGAVARLTLALEELAAAAESGASADEIAARRATATAARDEAQGVVRFTEVARIGSLPPELAGTSVRLVRVGSEVYLVGGGLYQIDAGGRRLVRVLAPGMVVSGGPVGILRDGGWGTTGVAVTDGAALYVQDDAGSWLRRPLGEGEVGTGFAACRLFRDSLYGLDPEGGRILKFAADRLDRAPEDWAHAGDAPELSLARDMVVDGQIHVLLADGRVLSFLGGLPLTPVAPRVTPPVSHPVALAGGLDSNFLYLAEPGVALDGTVGRVVRLDRTGQVVHQLLPPPPGGDATSRAAAAALADVRDLAVDEQAGALYFITGEAVWRAMLPTE